MECYSSDELKTMFATVGTNVQIDKDVKFISPQNISIGSNVRIDSWCFFSALQPISIGSNVHIGLGSYFLAGGGEITIRDFCGVSSRVTFLTSSDDYVDGWMTNPTIPMKYRKVKIGPITLDKHVIVGSGSVIMPGCHLNIGASVGALTFVTKNIPEFTVVSGNPARVVCKRDKAKLLETEQRYHHETNG